MDKNLEMPLIGLGTWTLYGTECENAVRKALELGYRHIDTADVYGNHEAIGRAIASWARHELFLTTKVGHGALKPGDVQEAVPRFLKELHVDYIDLLLIHWPDPDVDLIETLRVMQKFQEMGLTRRIGVSNFVRFHLDELASHPFQIYNNQIELHPYFQRRLLVEKCRQMGIRVTAYRPVARGAFERDPILQEISRHHNKSPSQIALRWLVQQEIAVIPKASNPKHLSDNLDIFDFALTVEEMEKIATLDRHLRLCAPSGYPIFED